jgi:hypothetical protein
VRAGRLCDVFAAGADLSRPWQAVSKSNLLGDHLWRRSTKIRNARDFDAGSIHLRHRDNISLSGKAEDHSSRSKAAIRRLTSAVAIIRRKRVRPTQSCHVLIVASSAILFTPRFGTPRPEHAPCAVVLQNRGIAVVEPQVIGAVATSNGRASAQSGARSFKTPQIKYPRNSSGLRHRITLTNYTYILLIVASRSIDRADVTPEGVVAWSRQCNAAVCPRRFAVKRNVRFLA